MDFGGVTGPVTVAWLVPHCGLYHALTVARLNMSNLLCSAKFAAYTRKLRIVPKEEFRIGYS